MNPQTQGQGHFLPFENIIKPNQVVTLPFLTPEQKAQYTDGTRNLWRKVQEYPQDHPERMAAYRRLSEISTRLKREMVKWRSEQGGQAAPQDPSRQLQRDSSMLMASQSGARQTAQPPALELSDRVKTEVRSLPLVLPPQLKSRSVEEQRAWGEGQKRFYATLLQKYENGMKQKAEFQEQVKIRQQRGSITIEEQQTIQSRMTQIASALSEAQKNCVAFKSKHEQARNQEIEEHQQRQQQLQQQQQQQQQQVPQQTPLNTQPAAQPPVPPQLTQPQDNIKVEPSSQNPLVSEVPRATANQQEQPSQNTPDPSQQSTTVTQSSQAQPPSINTTNTHAQSGKPVGPNSLQDSPQSAQSGMPNSQGPHPLTHQDALNRASRSYNQASQSSHAHPPQPPVHIQREQPTPTATSSRQGMRPISVAPLTQVQLAPARPTLSGGPGAAGPMGQPAIQKHPGFVLEGDGERVLSKKKLEELVRQVTGGSGAGSEGVELLDPDVEEVSYYPLICTNLETSSFR